MRIYAAVLVGLVVIGFVAVRLAYAHGELSKVSFSTAPAPAGIAPQATGTSLAQVWHSSDRPAGGTPYADGIVVGYDLHTVTGRDAQTGAARWHYTRSDETICSVVQQDSTTIAIYQRKGNCDEVTGFVTATGVAKWYRTLQDNGTSSVGQRAQRGADGDRPFGARVRQRRRPGSVELAGAGRLHRQPGAGRRPGRADLA